MGGAHAHCRAACAPLEGRLLPPRPPLSVTPGQEKQPNQGGERPDVSRLVMKFGGTSVADLERIRRVGRLVAAEVATGKKVAVVVSAMSGKTNELVAWR